MRFFITFILLIIAVAAAQLYFPWWSMAIACFIIGGIMGMSGMKSFWAGFLALLLLWGGYAWALSQGNILPAKMAELFRLHETFGSNSTLALIGITALLGAILGALSTMTGALGRNIFRSEKTVEPA